MARLIHYQAGAGTSARPNTIAANNAYSYIESSPWDGLVLNLILTYNFQNPGTTTTLSAVATELSAMSGHFTRCTHHYVNIHCNLFADPFDDWTLAQSNWVNLAQAIFNAGMDGIYYDNEEYSGLFWAYPGTAYTHTGTQTLSQYAEQWRLRGNQIMTAMRAVHPTIKVIHAHTPAWSQASMPNLVVGAGGDPVHSDGSDLRGYFAAGMHAAAPGSAIDGGEAYAFRTSSDFQASWNWLHNTWPSITPGTVIPTALQANWPQTYNVSFGIFDQVYPPGFSAVTAPSLQACVTNALNRADSVVWTYAENNDYLTPGATLPAGFYSAISSGKAAATSSIPAPTNLRVIG